MTGPWTEWEHVLKVDPDKDLAPEDTFADVCETGTDAIMIGGTTGITPEDIEGVLEACARHDVPLFLEPNAPEVALRDERLAGYLIPTVFNSADPFFLVGAHGQWVEMTDGLPWEAITTEAYLVLNPDSAAASYTQARTDLSVSEVAAYATVAERMFGQEIVYIEYSGTYGDRALVAAARDALEESSLFYGGGIHDRESAAGMAEVADVVIVGDLLHDEGAAAVRETVRGAKHGSE